MKLTQGQAVGGAAGLGALMVLNELFSADAYKFGALVVILAVFVLLTLFAHKSPPTER